MTPQDYIAALPTQLRGATLIEEGAALGAFFNASAQAQRALTVAPPQQGARRPYALQDGVAIIPVMGTLIQRLGYYGGWCGCTGYDGLALQLAAAVSDPSVSAIALWVDSPGGMVSGCFDLADQIHAARAVKPIYALVDETACSAAYALASAADHIVIADTGRTASIGVLWLHVDASKMLSDAGLAVTVVRSAPRKAEGNPFEPLSPAAREAAQADVDATMARFVATVARNRQIAPEIITSLEGRVLRASEALSLGLVDEVGPVQQAYAGLIAAANQF